MFMIIETIRKELKKSKVSRFKISKETGINEAALSRIYHGQRTCTAETADKLLQYFDYEVKKRKRGSK
jgi:plasmid maintenance system antidote protein VapI